MLNIQATASHSSKHNVVHIAVHASHGSTAMQGRACLNNSKGSLLTSWVSQQQQGQYMQQHIHRHIAVGQSSEHSSLEGRLGVAIVTGNGTHGAAHSTGYVGDHPQMSIAALAAGQHS
eukprot:GHUV01007387.1.p2 GENE.GHUV01007387.1~~GHUV01007387.1.p2  ORF type:complete len:118 (+),score=29.00 GHUV01007387.1:623-976(+)